MRKIDLIICHCSATRVTRDFSPEDLEAQILGHRDLPWVKKDCPCFDARAEYSNLKPLTLEQ